MKWGIAMIKHHPNNELLVKYSAGELPVTLSLAVAIHVDMCPVCQNKVAEIEALNAYKAFTEIDELTGENSIQSSSASFNQGDLGAKSNDLIDFAMLSAITEDESIDEVYQQPPVTVQVQQKNYTLPRALTRLGHSKFLQIGKLSRSRIDLDDGPLRASMLHIDSDGEIPEHTHTGFEVTLLLDGEFSDQFGHYVPGDFMMLDGTHQHSPQTKNGCLCFTVVSSALHFNKGLSKLLNPIGNLIY